jgi:hypothetical protein
LAYASVVEADVFKKTTEMIFSRDEEMNTLGNILLNKTLENVDNTKSRSDNHPH